jgi:hypothetical protein
MNKDLCPKCGGIGFKTITTYEGNPEFNIISSNIQKCSCTKDQKQFWLCGQLKGDWNITGSIWEFQGIFDSEEKAAAACRDQNYFIMPVTLNEELPHTTVFHDYCRYPRLEDEINTKSHLRELIRPMFSSTIAFGYATPEQVENRLDEMCVGSCCRCHEECYDCAIQKIEPPSCSGHVQGPIPCEQFVPKQKKCKFS